jgi:hypothetical protein
MLTNVLLAIALLACVGLPASAQSLAEASKKAKEERAKGQQWPTSANTVPVYDPAAAVATPDVAAKGTALVVDSTKTTATTTSTTTTRDETYWKTRMRAVVTKLSDDQAFLAAAITNEAALNLRANRGIDDFAAIRDRRQLAEVEHQWQESVKEVSRLKALVQNDTRAKADLELEAHRAGVPPGWLVLE